MASLGGRGKRRPKKLAEPPSPCHPERILPARLQPALVSTAAAQTEAPSGLTHTGKRPEGLEDESYTHEPSLPSSTAMHWRVTRPHGLWDVAVALGEAHGPSWGLTAGGGAQEERAAPGPGLQRPGRRHQAERASGRSEGPEGQPAQPRRGLAWGGAVGGQVTGGVSGGGAAALACQLLARRQFQGKYRHRTPTRTKRGTDQDQGQGSLQSRPRPTEHAHCPDSGMSHVSLFSLV